MAGVKEIKARIEGVQETRKITNAMYLVASTKLRHARESLDRTRPYFNATRQEVARIFRSGEMAESRYFLRDDGGMPSGGVCGILVITADKGLAGSYNMNAIRKAESILKDKPDSRLFVVGEYGRRHFRMRKIVTEPDFLYTAQDPTLDRARSICTRLLDLYDQKELNEIVAVYTDMQSSLSSTSQVTRLLPLERARFFQRNSERRENEMESIVTADPYAGSMIYSQHNESNRSGNLDSESSNGDGKSKSAFSSVVSDVVGKKNPEFLFVPSVEDVLGAVMRSYISGFFYSALVDSFCCEQNARVTAMDAAGRNAGELLDTLSLQLNRERQGAITQEITEISAGAKAQRKNREEKPIDRRDLNMR